LTESVDVLLVEDNEDHVFLTKKALERFKDPALTIHVVTDGVQAIQFMTKQPPHQQAPTPDLILLDIKLPNKDGFDVLSTLKNDKKLRCIPIVMLTSSDAEKDIARSYALGSNSYVTKPIKTDELFKKLKNIPSYWVTTNTLPTKA
jgi:two-component system, chemotaxis family, response regulator Rcp1